MSNPGAASSGESMPDGLGLNAWWDEPAYKRCDSFSRRGAFILHKLLKCDPAKLKVPTHREGERGANHKHS